MSDKIKTQHTDAESVSSRKKRPGKRKRTHRRNGPFSRPIQYPLLCFDTETTNHGELLELSVFDLDGNEVYHQYFRPRAKTWPTDIHHITPEMVAECKRFSSHRKEVGRLLSSARYLLGCALTNDLHTLRRHGIHLDEKRHKIVDIQNWYWLLNDNSDRMDRYQTGLSTIAETYGLAFGDDEMAHSATADTRLTLQCYKALVNNFEQTYPAAGQSEFTISTETEECAKVLSRIDDLQDRYQTEYDRAMHIYRMKNLSGFISVLNRPQGYSVKYTRFEPKDAENVVFSIPVTDRVKAEIDLRKHFEPIQVKGFTGFYEMKDSDFEYIKSYRNDIDLETYLKRMRLKGARQDISPSQKVMRSLPFAKNRTNTKTTTSKPASSKSKSAAKTAATGARRAASQAMRAAKKALKSR